MTLLRSAFVAAIIQECLYISMILPAMRNKWVVWSATLCFGPMSYINIVLPSMFSRAASESDQGVHQGALCTVLSLAQCLGPIVLSLIYKESVNWAFPVG